MENLESKKLTYPQITQEFLEFEEKNDLLLLEINGVLPWQMARIIIFLKIVDHFIPGNTQPVSKSKRKHITDLLYRVFINSVLFNPFVDNKKSDILIMESGRKYRDEDHYIDIYTEYLSQEFEQKKIPFTRYETDYNVDNNLFDRKLAVKHLDFVLLSIKVRKMFLKNNFSANEREIMSKIDHDLKVIFGFTIDVENIFADQIRKFKAEFFSFEKLFRFKAPKEIFITNSCDKAAMILAAKKNGILVNELQHGLMSDKDVISNFPYTSADTLLYFPDRFYIWDNVDMFFGKIPLKADNIIPFKNSHIENWVRNLEMVPKEDKTILVISQPYGSEDIKGFMIDNISTLSDYSIIYKMHPAENEEVFMRFKTSFAAATNVRFVNNEESIYMLLKRSKYVLGIYSSALFEASAFDSKVILLNLPGVEMSFPLLNNKENKLININQKLVSLLNK